MSTQEELADTIAVALRGEDQFGYTDISDLSDAVLDSRYDLLAVADAVLADYQRKPRTVDNIEDLRELPVGSVVKSKIAVYQKFRTWWAISGDPREFPVQSIPLPATVLFTPEATA